MNPKILILVVDSENDFCASLQEKLGGKNCDVIIASNMENARQMALSNRPNLILLGTIMPRGDAFRLHKWLRQNPALKDIPQVVLDAAPENHLTRGWRRDEGMQIEAIEYFCKPIKPAALADAVWKLMDVKATEIKVLIADDHAMVREGIRTLLNLQKDIYIVGEATNGTEAIKKALELLPDVVLMDIVMPEIDGIEATRQIFNQGKEGIKVLMLSQYDDEQNLLASKEAGALGFISKNSASTRLLEAVRAAGRGEHPNSEQQYLC